MERSNEQTLYHLERQGRTGPGVVPFLGAGLSTAFGLKDWKSLLLEAAPPRIAREVSKRLDRNDYEGAAEVLLDELKADGFQNLVAASARDSDLASVDFTRGTVSLLPLLAEGPVVTTNFDRVLERAFKANGAPFEGVISGPRPDLIADALHGNRRVLIKLHGDWQDRVGRTFAKSDYDTNYGKAQPEKKRELLTSAERLLFSGRSLLFIGASLNQDRTVELLKEVHNQYAGIRHFTINSIPKGKRAFEKKEAQLRNLGVLPLWYRANDSSDHAREVYKLVMTIVVRISVRTVPIAVTAPARTLPPGLPAHVSIGRAERPAPVVPTPPTPAAPLPGVAAHFERVVRLLEDGRLTFFLGSAIHAPTKLMARTFYEELARVFECSALKEEPFAVAQYIADRYGRQSLYAEISKLFARTPLVPRATHDLFAAWASFRTSDGRQLPYPMIVTTNYDDLLERSLFAAQLQYHLFSYQADGLSQGLFYYRAPNDVVRVIERPRNIQTLGDDNRERYREFVIVKLNGGFDRQRHIPESYATTRLDYWALAARIPDVLPAIVRDTLSMKPLLFLGSGLAAADIESVIRFSHRDHPGSRSWAVVQNMGEREYWRQCGVDIIDVDINDYARELHARLAANGPGRAPSQRHTGPGGPPLPNRST
ncbi:MAG: SIR2 family protein [Candidatus Rokuibacteriota bacterium]